LYISVISALLSVIATFKLIKECAVCSAAAVKSVFEAAFSKIEADQSFRQSDHAQALELVVRCYVYMLNSRPKVSILCFHVPNTADI
jgi:hypothetical protein